MRLRPQFSLRWLLIAITALAVVFYVLFVHPTVIANQFIAAIESGDFHAAEELYVGGTETSISDLLTQVEGPTVKAKLFPSKWRDVWGFKRSMLIQIIPRERKSGSYLPGVGYQINATATIVGVRPGPGYVVSFSIDVSGVRE
jgi:hypothetical protein